MSKLTLLIPANKESESLPIFLEELSQYKFNKLIVLQEEDKVTIDSISNRKDIEIYVQEKSGYGNALKEGIENIKTEYFCIINADGSMDPKYLNEMLSSCSSKDFIFASRYLVGGGSDDDDIITLVGNKCFSFLGNFLFNLNISDILYTYILGKTSAARDLMLKYNDFRICVEIPIKIKRKRFEYSSLPSKERKRIAGKKKVNAFKDGFLILMAIFNSYFKDTFKR